MGKIVLIQKTETFEKALYVSKIWNKNKYNIKDEFEGLAEENNDSYMYYIFESPNEITIRGNHRNKILVWREEDELKYGAILE